MILIQSFLAAWILAIARGFVNNLYFVIVQIDMMLILLKARDFAYVCYFITPKRHVQFWCNLMPCLRLISLCVAHSIIFYKLYIYIQVNFNDIIFQFRSRGRDSNSCKFVSRPRSRVVSWLRTPVNYAGNPVLTYTYLHLSKTVNHLIMNHHQVTI